MSDEPSKVNFSNYGIYEVMENLEIYLPNTTIKIEKIGENAFSYFRKDSEGKILEKMIPTNMDSLKIEIAPMRPLNHPARRQVMYF